MIHNGALVAMMTYFKNGEREKERERERERERQKKENRYILVNKKRFRTFTACTVRFKDVLKTFCLIVLSNLKHIGVFIDLITRIILKRHFVVKHSVFLLSKIDIYIYIIFYEKFVSRNLISWLGLKYVKFINYQIILSNK